MKRLGQRQSHQQIHSDGGCDQKQEKGERGKNNFQRKTPAAFLRLVFANKKETIRCRIHFWPLVYNG